MSTLHIDVRVDLISACRSSMDTSAISSSQLNLSEMISAQYLWVFKSQPKGERKSSTLPSPRGSSRRGVMEA